MQVNFQLLYVRKTEEVFLVEGVTFGQRLHGEAACAFDCSLVAGNGASAAVENFAGLQVLA
jgi:hypothetical protein